MPGANGRAAYGSTSAQVSFSVDIDGLNTANSAIQGTRAAVDYGYSALVGRNSPQAKAVGKALGPVGHALEAGEVMVHVTSGIDIQQTSRLLQRTGFGVIGGNYARVL